ncbi:hypothetical protein PIROE2DRAFT_5236 [Piromyces sp. E2]|nr:hypothetical protein PIROE2DRAFT_5236 [Piromyces sp. E2]|eukprot:OUM67373.1 hypothetical protein PIROE2DRAFT_5236 [Piromyces sp. E2]
MNDTLDFQPFKKLTKVKSLFMVNVKVDLIKNLLTKFKNLKNLSIDHYALSQQSISEISSLTKLEELKLEFCYYNDVNDIDSFKKLKNLKKLTISNLHDTTFPYSKSYSLEDLDQLEYLDLHNNEATITIKNLGYLDKLKYLTNITSIPSSIGDLEKLKELNLDDNKIKKLPSTIGSLEKLTCNTANNNLIESLPSSIGELISVQEIYLENNLIKTIPNTIENLDNLKYFKNKITKIPNAISNLKRIINLHLDHNQIKKIPSSLGNAKSLQYLYLNDNIIDDVLPDELSNNIDIKGKTLTLEFPLYSCAYNLYNNDNKIYSICKVKDVPCLIGIDKDIKPCKE